MGITTTKGVQVLLDEADVSLLSDDVLSGICPLFIIKCTRQNIPTFISFVESYVNFSDTTACLEALFIVSKVLGIHFNFKQLEEESERIRIGIRELMLIEQLMKQSQILEKEKIHMMYR